jgi:dTDP-4-dehydrorhamnose reductase
MSILVVGGSGFFGKYYLKLSKFKKSIIPTCTKKKKFFKKFDILQDDITKLLTKNLKAVVILSAISNPDQCIKKKKLSKLINVIKMKKIINELIKRNLYFIFFSTEYVFFGKRGNYTEKSVALPISFYGKQKKAIEAFLKKKKYKNYSILRISKILGSDIKDQSLLSKYLNDYIYLRKKSFSVATDQMFTPIFVNDLVKITDSFVKEKINGLYNVCGSVSYSRFDLIDKFFKFLEIKDVIIKKSKLNDFKFQDNIPINVTMKNNLIKKKLNLDFTKLKKIFLYYGKKYQPNKILFQE